MSQTAAVTLRPEVPEDRPFLRELYLSTRDDEVGFRDMDPGERTRLLEEQFELREEQYRAAWPGAYWTIITVAGKPAGRLCVAQMAAEMRLVDLALLPEYRSHGIGTTLLKSIQAEAMRTQCPLRLHVAVVNAARAFYDRLGFKPVASNEAYTLLEWVPPAPPGS